MPGFLRTFLNRDTPASRTGRLSDAAAQWRVIAYAFLPFAAASLVIYVAAERDVLFHPHSGGFLLQSAIDIAVKLTFGAGLWLAPLALPWIRPRAFVLAMAPIVCILFVPNMMYALEYRELISIGTVEAAMSTNAKESLEFLSERSRSAVLSVLYLALLVSIFAWSIRRMPPRGTVLGGRLKLILASLTFIVLAIGSVAQPRIFPVTTIKNTIEYFAYLEAMDKLAHERVSFAFGATRPRSIEPQETYVIVIGESLRRRQLSHYGYGRKTSPRLDSTSNTIFLEDVISAAGTSQRAIKTALTPATAATVHKSTKPSILRIAREIGFATAWISNQDRVVDTEITIIADDADTTIFTNHDWAAFGSFDDAVLGPLDGALAGSADKKLIVIHLMGSHGEYWRRYPRQVARFASTDCGSVPNGCTRGWTHDQIAMINEYDNSVAYTDSVVSEIIQRVTQQGGISAVLFFADHGEELFDTHFRRMGHGFHDLTRYEVEIPSFVWLSPSLKQYRPDLETALQCNRFRAASSEDFFYAMADLLASDFSLMDRERSLFSLTYRERRRLVATPDRNLVDFACLRQPSQECPRASFDTAPLLSAAVSR